MADVLTSAQRSYCMSRIRGTNTRPEMVVRSLVHHMGFRFRLHRRDLPGRPDLVFVRDRRVILVHGCFWHMHRCRAGRVQPATNAEFWRNKRLGNVRRDHQVLRRLRADGWRVLTVWECQTRDPASLRARLTNFLVARGGDGPHE